MIIYHISYFWVGGVHNLIELKVTPIYGCGFRAERKKCRDSKTLPKDPPMGGAFW